MSQTSPNLSLPYLQPSQAQKDVTHNEALQMLDLLVQMSVQSFEATSPPALPVAGETHVLGAAPTGDWAGQAGMVASWNGTAWLFFAAQEGWRAWNPVDEELRVLHNGSWQRLTAETQNLDGIGINATSDATNRLVVAAPATLLNHDGAGHQLKINKAGPGDTNSLLFQTGWSGRAELGLAGSDDLSFKVSADGASWNTAMSLRASDGMATFSEATVNNGLYLGGTTAEHRLDLYETGSYTPMLIDESGNSVSLAPKTVPYVRIGRLVTIFFSFLGDLDVTGLTTNDNIAVTLPFTNTEDSFSSVEMRDAGGSGGPYHWFAPSGESHALIRSLATNSRLKVNDITSGVTDIIGGILIITPA